MTPFLFQDCPCYTNCSDGCPCSYESTFCPGPDDVYFYVMEPAIYAKVGYKHFVSPVIGLLRNEQHIEKILSNTK